MKVTGYKLREALRRWQLRRDTASTQFAGSLVAFPGDDKPKPDAIAATVLAAETAIARLQAAQTRYNLNVNVTVDGMGGVPLLFCTKAVGGLARVEKLWRGATGSEKKRSSLYDYVTRAKDQEQAVRVVSFDDAAKQAEVHGRKLAALREAIAAGNATELTIEDLDAALFE